MGVVLFKFREGCGDLVIPFSSAGSATLQTILSVWCAHQDLLPFSLSPWRLPAEEAMPWTVLLVRKATTTLSSRSKLCIIMFLTGVEVNQEN